MGKSLLRLCSPQVVSLVSSFFLLQAPSNRVRTSRAGMRWASPITPRWEGLFWRPGWGLHRISAVQCSRIGKHATILA